MKKFCNDGTTNTGLVDYNNLVGAKVIVNSSIMNNGFFKETGKNLKTIKDIIFRISLDGKTFSRVILEEYPELVFTLKDLTICQLSKE